MERRVTFDSKVTSAIEGRDINVADCQAHKKRILVVEDEALIALQLEMDIEDTGHSVAGTCMSLRESLQFIESKEIDGAILDVDLRGVDVFPAAEKLLEKGIPFVFHTGHGDKYKIEERFPRSTVFKKPTATNLMIQSLFL